MKITIRIIDHQLQRYNSPGDYWEEDNGDIEVRVSNLGNETYQAAIFIHELIEYFLLRKKGTPTEPEVMAFDIAFEEKREQGLVGEYDEPGFAEDSPYRQEHSIATACEMAFIAMSGESWNKYDEAVIALIEKWKR